LFSTRKETTNFNTLLLNNRQAQEYIEANLQSKTRWRTSNFLAKALKSVKKVHIRKNVKNTPDYPKKAQKTTT